MSDQNALQLTLQDSYFIAALTGILSNGNLTASTVTDQRKFIVEAAFLVADEAIKQRASRN